MHRHRRALFSLCLTLGLLAGIAGSTSRASAAAPRWQRATPFGGPLALLVEAPSAPQVLYAVAQTRTLYRSGDGGATWQPRPAPVFPIVALLVDPFDPQTVFCNTEIGRLLRSRDGGRSWSELVPDPFSGGSVDFDRAHPGVVFAATQAGLFRSADRGDTWQPAAFAGTPVAAVAVDPHASSTLFAATSAQEFPAPYTFWKSTDGGATWVETGLAAPQRSLDFSGPRFVFDPAHPGTLYILFLTDFRLAPVFRSTDGGDTWTELTATAGLHDLAVAANGDLFGAGDYGVARSRDGGDTWDPPLPSSYFTAQPRDSMAQLAASGVPGRVLAAGATGFWISTDSGAGWTPANQGILAQGAYSVAIAPSGPPTVLTVAWSGIFRSTDQGSTWQRLHTRLEGPQPFSLDAIDPRRPATIYGTGFDSVADYAVVSRDGGRTWTQLPVPYDCNGSGSICDVGMFVAAVDPHDGAIFVSGHYFYHFGGSGDFLLRSDDGFATWRELNPLHRLGSLIVDTDHADTLYGLTCTGLHRSGDAGATWQKTGRGLPKALCPPGGGVPTLVRDPQDPRKLYAGTLTQGVFVSTDGGVTFRPMNRGLETAAAVTILVDPQNPSRIYAGVPERGVFRWNAKNRRWTPLNLGLPLQDFYGVIGIAALDPQHPSILYAASASQGVFRLDLEAASEAAKPW